MADSHVRGRALCRPRTARPAAIPEPDHHGAAVNGPVQSAIAAGEALLIDNADLDPAWIKVTLIPLLTDPGRIAAMSARASADSSRGRAAIPLIVISRYAAARQAAAP
jgi:hypothetical protein